MDLYGGVRLTQITVDVKKSLPSSSVEKMR